MLLARFLAVCCAQASSVLGLLMAHMGYVQARVDSCSLRVGVCVDTSTTKYLHVAIS
jgi:hypothetical protein